MEKEIKMSFNEYERILYERDMLDKENRELKGFLNKSGALQILISKESGFREADFTNPYLVHRYQEFDKSIILLHWDNTLMTKYIRDELNNLQCRLNDANAQIEHLKSRWYFKLFGKW